MNKLFHISNSPTDDQDKDLDVISKFREFIIDNDHPCVMAQTVFSLDQVDFHRYSNFGSRETSREIFKDLEKYISNYDFGSKDFFTFFTVFDEQENLSEEKFEKLLWKQLQYLHEIDNKLWDPKVSDDPEDKEFSFSLAGRAFYFVGLHPCSSRLARQSPYPAIAFNLHSQFEELRKMGSYQKVRDKVRERDVAFQGNINPMMEDFGSGSEARQYSGRKVGEEWKCPFLSGKI